MLKVDIQQVFISTAAVFGIGLLWINFNEKVYKTVRHLIFSLFTDESEMTSSHERELDERELELDECESEVESLSERTSRRECELDERELELDECERNLNVV